MPITATQRAEAMALQVFIAARLHNGRVITHDLVDAVMSRDADKEQGKANKETVRRIIRKRAELEQCRVIFTPDERYWAIREQLHHMSDDEVHALRDSIAEGGDDDPRAWDKELIDAISVRMSRRLSPRRLWSCEPVSIRLWRNPAPVAAPAEAPAGEQATCGKCRATVTFDHNERWAAAEAPGTNVFLCTDGTAHTPAPSIREQQQAALTRLQADADTDRAAFRADMDDRVAAEHQAHGAPVPAGVQARIDARTAPARRVLEGVIVEHNGTTDGSTPSHATHPDVVAARTALAGMAVAAMTDHHDVTAPTDAETAVRGYLVEPRGNGRVAVYWLEGGRIVRRDNAAHGPALDCLADRLTRRGWKVERMLRSSQCVFAHRPAEETAPTATQEPAQAPARRHIPIAPKPGEDSYSHLAAGSPLTRGLPLDMLARPALPAPAPAPAPEERQHVRTVNGGTPQLIPSRDALAEINAAMMGPGKRAVREMSEGRGHARIVYRDGRTVTLLPATLEDRAAYQAADTIAPRDLEDLALALFELGETATGEALEEIRAAHAGIEAAWEALRRARTVTDRYAAHDMARAAVDRARTLLPALADASA